MPNLLPLAHLTFASQVPAPKLMAKAPERAWRRRPNLSWQITTRPAYGNPKNRVAAPDLFTSYIFSDTAARKIVHVQSTLASDCCSTPLKERGMSREPMRHPCGLTQLTG